MTGNIRKEKFSNQACKYIQDKIISGELKSGERLVETKIARELGVSQSPVREALRELEVMGLVEIKPYSGCFVLPIDETKLQQIYSLRSLLECFAVQEGIKNISDADLDTMAEALKQMEIAAANEDKLALSLHDVMFHSSTARIQACSLHGSLHPECRPPSGMLLQAATALIVTVAVHEFRLLALD